MKKIIAILVCKMATFLAKLIKGSSTCIGGTLALKIDKDIFKKIEKPKKIVCITGTNGKTTTTNLICDILKENNIEYISNNMGANLKEGILTTLINEGNIFGKTKKDLGIFEVDERGSALVYEYITPDYLIITNLFRDSIKRNANTDYISYILSSTIPDTTKIIVNGDDIIASNVTTNNKIYFGIEKQPGEDIKQENVLSDINICPICKEKLEYEYRRINHIGKVYCKNGHIKSPDLDYIGIDLDKFNKKFKIKKSNDEIVELPIIQESTFNISNQIAAYILTSELGISDENIIKAYNKMNIVATRYINLELKDNARYINILTKGQNPMACSNVFKSVIEETGTKCIILDISDMGDNTNNSESTMWIFETNYELLKNENIKKIIIVSPREKDIYLRCMLAGIEKEKLVKVENVAEILNEVQKIDTHIDKYFLLSDIFRDKRSKKIKQEFIKRYGK